ncbi:MAG: VOC family protein [Actinomycetota bacterium]|nr:VOC family protein [Actinomycetota bacterium]MDQ2955570.1 VOC family protein [Actinomycetota bacterium]
MTTAGLRFQVSIDCADPAAQSKFWCLALGYIEQPPPEGFDSWDAFADTVDMPADERDRFGSVVDPAGLGPRLLFHKVAEGKVVKNRLHFDINIGGARRGDERRATVREHAGRLVDAGATLVEEREDDFSWWIVLTDPGGNEFCLQ